MQAEENTKREYAGIIPNDWLDYKNSLLLPSKMIRPALVTWVLKFY